MRRGRSSTVGLWVAALVFGNGGGAWGRSWRARLVPVGPATQTTYLLQRRPLAHWRLGPKALASLPAAQHAKFRSGWFWSLGSLGGMGRLGGTCVLVDRDSRQCDLDANPLACVVTSGKSVRGYCEWDPRRGTLTRWLQADIDAIVALEPGARPKRALASRRGRLALLDLQNGRLAQGYGASFYRPYEVDWRRGLLLGFDVCGQLAGWDLSLGLRLKTVLDGFPDHTRLCYFLSHRGTGVRTWLVTIGPDGRSCPKNVHQMPQDQAFLPDQRDWPHQVAAVRVARRGYQVRIRYQGELKCPEGFGDRAPLVYVWLQPPGGGAMRVAGVCGSRSLCPLAARRLAVGIWNLESRRIESLVVLRRGKVDQSVEPVLFSEPTKRLLYLDPTRGLGPWGGDLTFGFRLLWIQKVVPTQRGRWHLGKRR